MKEQKETLRQEALRHRSRMDPRDEDPDEACDIFFDKIAPKTGQVIAAYWPMEREFDSQAILERLLVQGHICALPVVQKDSRILRFARWDDTIELKKSAQGVHEPLINETTQWLEPDIVIVPFIAFDRRGYRLGYGGGYYDATLSYLRKKKEILAVGVGFARQACLFNLPIEDHDERLDWVITPQDSHCFIPSSLSQSSSSSRQKIQDLLN